MGQCRARYGAIAVLLVASGIAGCTDAIGASVDDATQAPSQDDPEPDSDDGIDGEPATYPVARPDGSAIDVVEIDVANLGAEEIALESIWTSENEIPGTEPYPIPLALDEQGRMLLAMNDPNHFDPRTLEYSETTRVFLWDDGDLTPLGETDPLVPDDPHRNAIAGWLGDDLAIWTESAVVQGPPAEWRKFSQRIDGDAPVLLAEGYQTDELQRSGLQSAGTDAHPVVDGLMALSYAEEDAEGTITSFVLTVPVDGGDPMPLIENAMSPAALDGGWVAFRTGAGGRLADVLADTDALVYVTPDGASRDLLRIDLGQRLAMPILTASQTRFAMQFDDSAYIGDLDGESVLRLTPGRGALPILSDSASCGDRVLVGVKSNEPETAVQYYLLDPEDGSSLRIPHGPMAGEPLCAGEYLVLSDYGGSSGLTTTTLARWSE